MGHTHTKRMIQGAMIAALFGVLSLINTYTGSLFDIFICYGMVVPLVWYGYTYSIKDNVIVCIVSMIVIAMVGLPFFVISSFSSCLTGLFIGEALKRELSKGKILLGTFIVMLMNNILLYEVFAGLLQMDIADEMTLMYQEIVAVMPQIAQTVSLDMVISIIPIVLIIMSVMEMYVVILICQLTLSRLKVQFPGNFHLATMHLSEKTGLIVAGFMFSSYLLQNFMNVESIYLTYIYVLGVFTFALQGLSFVLLFLIMKQKRGLVILAFLALFIPMVSTIYVVVGIIDIFSDLRRNLLYNNNNDEEGEL